MKKINKIDKLINSWIPEICIGRDIDYLVVEHCGQSEGNGEFEHKFKFKFYTENNVYSIICLEKDDNGVDKGYLGCTVSSRKSRAGEDWNRGNDLPDGPFSYQTWQKIKNRIIKYEIVLLEQKVECCCDCKVSEEPTQKVGYF